MRVLLIDTETNSQIDKHGNGYQEPIEVAQADWSIKGGVSDLACRRYKPINPIVPAAAAKHGILMSDLEGKPPSSTAFDDLPKADVWVCHNIKFDWVTLGSPPDVKQVCTLALARKAWPSFGSHSLSALYLELFGLTPENLDAVRGAHAADQDVCLMSMVLDRIIDTLKIKDIPSLCQASEDARMPEYMPFGKHALGADEEMPISEIPGGYVQWALKNIDDMDPYLEKALKRRQKQIFIAGARRGGQSRSRSQSRSSSRSDSKVPGLF